jgi:hypothetical protein
MTIASRNQSSHYQEAKSNLQSLVKQTCQVGLGFAVMLLVTAGRPSAFGLSVTVGLGIAFVTWGEVRRLNSDNLSISSFQKSTSKPRFIGGKYELLKISDRETQIQKITIFRETQQIQKIISFGPFSVSFVEYCTSKCVIYFSEKTNGEENSWDDRPKSINSKDNS